MECPIPFQVSFRVSVSFCLSCVFLFFVFILSAKNFCSLSRYERQGEFSIEDGSDWDA